MTLIIKNISSISGTKASAGTVIPPYNYVDDWTYRTSLSAVWTTAPIAYEVIWTGSEYFAVGSSARIGTSTDGVTWTNRTAGLTATNWATAGDIAVTTVCYANGIYVIGGGDAKIATSTDAVTWTYQTGLRTTSWGVSETVKKIIYANGQFLAVGGQGRFATSPDGVTWTYNTSMGTTWGADSIEDIIYAGGKYVLVGRRVPGSRIATSTDLINWTFTNTAVGTDTTIILYAVSWNGSTYVAAGAHGRHLHRHGHDGRPARVVHVPGGPHDAHGVGLRRLVAGDDEGEGAEGEGRDGLAAHVEAHQDGAGGAPRPLSGHAAG